MKDEHTLGANFGTEDRYRMLVEAVADYAIFMLDPNGTVVSWNTGAQRLKGYTEREILGRHVSTFYPEDDIEAGVPLRTLTTAAREGRFEAEGWRIRKNGERFWAHIVVDAIRSDSGELLGYAKVTRDLSERREAERSLRQSEVQFKLLVQSVTDYAIYMLDPNGIVSNWNAGAQRIKGYTPAEVVGTHFSRFYRDEDRATGLPARALEVAAREGRFESEGWRVRKDGSQFWASVVIDPIRDPAGRLLGFAKVTRDVTDKRENQLALERARESLFQAQKLDAIGQLTGGVAHDFNNLLMVVLSSLELLRRRVPPDEKITRLIDNAVQGAKRGVTLTQRMLAFARRQELKPEAVDVALLVHGMCDLLARSLGPSITVDVRFPDALFPVQIDANQLELAILNLAVNARDAMPRGGTLAITATREVVEHGEAGPKAGLPTGTYVRLAIADTGEGMDAETLAHATEPFFTTKGAGKGTGLGLSMIDGLAAQSGGKFALGSAPGMGTTAELWLPVAAQAPAPASSTPPAATPAEPADLAAMLVVAVDDDALVLAGTVSMLEELGHTVLPATSAAQAIDLVRAHPSVAIVITDQMMPGTTGTELLDRLRAEHPGLAMILATGYDEFPSGSHPDTLRLRKPFDQSELAAAMRKVLAEARLRPS